MVSTFIKNALITYKIKKAIRPGPIAEYTKFLESNA